MRIELSLDPRDFVARDWTDVARADPVATFFHQPRYLKLYWEEFGHEGDLLLAFGIDGDGATGGAVAFERVGPTLRFLGGTEVTDYMGPVARPGSEDAFAKELFDALHGVEGWTEADLRGLPADSPWLGRLRGAAEASGLAVEAGDDSVAPFLPLPPTVEEYMASLPGKLRHELKRKARKLREETNYQLVRTTAATLADDLDQFVALHRSSEGPKGKFMQPGMEIFFRRLGQEFLPDDVFRLTFVEIEGRKVAGAIGFSYGETYSLYNSAYDREWSRVAPGMVLVADLVVEAIEAGCRAFDLLKGDLPYKYRFGATPREVKRLVIPNR